MAKTPEKGCPHEDADDLHMKPNGEPMCVACVVETLQSIRHLSTDPIIRRMAEQGLADANA